MKNLSRAAQTYIIGAIIAGIAGTALLWRAPEIEHPLVLILACLLATLLQIFKIEGTTARSSYNLSWVIYGAAFAGLGGQAMLLTILVAHIGEWLWHRYPWYIQSFNIAAFTISTLVAEVVFQGWLALPFDLFGVREIFGVLLAMLTFTLLNHFLVGYVIKLARGQSLSESGVFTLSTLTIDFGLLCLGASAAIAMQTNPAAILLLLIVAYLVQSALRVPALERKSEQDSKTGLYNAQHFDQAIQRELTRSQKQTRPLTVVMADLDKMRDINNTYGHLAGDIVLKKIAQILQALTSDGDVVARFGGEEFGILLPGITPEEAVVKVEAMRKSIETAEFIASNHTLPIKVTMSFGVAGYPGEKQTVKGIIHNADIAVYAAKHRGRNQVILYHPDLPPLSTERNETSPPDATDIVVAEVAIDERASVTMPASAVQAADDASARTYSVPTYSASTDEATTYEQSAHMSEAINVPIVESEIPTAEPAAPTRAGWIQSYIGAMVVGAVGLISLSMFVLPPIELDWIGILVFMLLAVSLEVIATQIYSRDASVSTSVATTIGATMAFGPIGAILSCIVIAMVNQFRNRKPINRLLFNLSNHLIACALCLLLIRLDPAPLLEWPVHLQFTFAILASIVIYLSSTLLLTGVLYLSTEQGFVDIWQERFKWLGLHYVALGIVAFGLVYTYNIIGAFAVLVMLIPLFMLHFSQHQYIEATKSMVEQLNEKNQVLSKRNKEVQHLNDELLLALASTIDLRDPFVVEHSRHVARYAALVAKELGLSPARVHLTYQAGLIHDIGKLAIPEAILFKPGRLTNDEYEVIKEHVTVGADLLDDFQSLQRVGIFVRHHHERFDGRGYPDHLKGEDIPLEARILALADAVEAMASDRPYRPGSTVAAILKEIRTEAGSQFDPHVVEAFVNVVQTQGDATIVNSARNIELPELKSNASMREDFATWAAPTLPAQTSSDDSIMPTKVAEGGA